MRTTGYWTFLRAHPREYFVDSTPHCRYFRTMSGTRDYASASEFHSTYCCRCANELVISRPHREERTRLFDTGPCRAYHSKHDYLFPCRLWRHGVEGRESFAALACNVIVAQSVVGQS